MAAHARRLAPPDCQEYLALTNAATCIGYRFGSFALDLERGCLMAADGRERPLRPKSFALLRLLVENAGRLLSKERIMEALWPDLFVTENNVTQCIHDIRSALGCEADLVLRTRPRRGYLFTSDIVTVAAAELAPAKERHPDRAAQGRPEFSEDQDGLEGLQAASIVELKVTTSMLPPAITVSRLHSRDANEALRSGPQAVSKNVEGDLVPYLVWFSKDILDHLRHVDPAVTEPSGLQTD